MASMNMKTKDINNLPPMQVAKRSPFATVLNGSLYVVDRCDSSIPHNLRLPQNLNFDRSKSLERYMVD